MMIYRQQTFIFASMALLALVSHQESGVSMVAAEDEGNSTSVDLEIDCTCDDGEISCSDTSDEEACFCEDGDVVCEDTPVFVAPVQAPTPMAEEPPAPDTAPTGDMSGAFHQPSMISMAISAAGIAAVALN